MLPLISFGEAVAAAQGRGARLIAIDGLPLAGKSMLADRLIAALNAQCIYLDDFVKPEAEWRSRTAPSFPFDYIRYDAFLDAVKAVARDGRCSYAPYDWETGGIGAGSKTISPGGPVIVEGVSALHPDLAPLYDLRFWVESDAATTMDASIKRGVGAWEREWRDLFLPSVALYLKTDPSARADLRVAGRGASP